MVEDVPSHAWLWWFFVHKASAWSSYWLATVYHSPLRCVTACKALAVLPHIPESFGLYSLTYLYILILKFILGLLPSDLCGYNTLKTSLCSKDSFLLTLLWVHTEMGKQSFMFSALKTWHHLQKKLQPDPIQGIKNLVKGFGGKAQLKLLFTYDFVRWQRIF